MKLSKEDTRQFDRISIREWVEGNLRDPMVRRSGERNGNKLPNTATNMYSYLLAGFILLLAGLFLIRRRKA